MMSLSITAIVALVTIVAVLLIAFRSLLWPVIRVVGRVLGALVAVAATLAAAYYSWPYIASAIPGMPAVSMPDVNWAAIVWTTLKILAGLAVIALFILFFRWMWRRLAAAGARTPLLPRFVWRALLAVVLIVVLFVVPWEDILSAGYRQYAPVNWPELLRDRAGSWTQQTWLALILLVAVATLLAFDKKGWAIATAALAAMVFIIPSGVMQAYWPNGVSSFSAAAPNPLPRTCNGETDIITLPQRDLSLPRDCSKMVVELYAGSLLFEDNKHTVFELTAGTPATWPKGYKAVLVRAKTPATKAKFIF